MENTFLNQAVVSAASQGRLLHASNNVPQCQTLNVQADPRHLIIGLSSPIWMAGVKLSMR